MHSSADPGPGSSYNSYLVELQVAVAQASWVARVTVGLALLLPLPLGPVAPVAPTGVGRES